jgi:alpha-ketoglutarate-dependent taurine dioxygenase
VSEEIRSLLERRGVLLFRNINLGDAEQIQFAQTLGSILSPRALSPTGGQTEFANTYATLVAKRDELKAALDLARGSLYHRQLDPAVRGDLGSFNRPRRRRPGRSDR